MLSTRVSPAPHPAVRIVRPVLIRFLLSLVDDPYKSFLKLELTDKENRDLPRLWAVVDGIGVARDHSLPDIPMHLWMRVWLRPDR